jgi:4'-phosphopantetheinyl transferase
MLFPAHNPPSPGTAPGHDEVHLWFADLDSADPSRFLPFLSPGELARALRYHFPRDRDRFIVRRGVLRELLAGYRDADPCELRLCEGRNGKPALSPAAGGAHLTFSLSCSGNAALFAIARDRELGVDLEQIRCFPEMDEIVGRFFSPAERKAFNLLGQEERAQAFFVYWTAKEAFVKATGEGLSRPLHSFDVSPVPGSAAASVIGNRDGSPSGWSLRTLMSGGSAAAVVMKSDFSIRPRLWDDRSARGRPGGPNERLTGEGRRPPPVVGEPLSRE